MMQISLVAYIVGGMLLDMAYFDLIYQLMAMTVSLELAVSSLPEGLEETPGASSVGASSTVKEWWRASPVEEPSDR